MSSWLGVALCLTSIGTGKVGLIFQKQAIAGGLPVMSFMCNVFCLYVRSPRWMLGSFLSVVAGISALWALSFTPYSVVTPISFCGVVISAGLSHFMLGEILSFAQWGALFAILLCGVMFAYTIEEETVDSTLNLLHLLVWTGGVLIGGLLELLLRVLRRMDGMLSSLRAAFELVAALQVSVLFTVGSVTTVAVIRSMPERGFWFVFIVAQLAGWQPLFGLLAEQRALKHARVNALNAYVTSISLVTNVVLGVLLLGEVWPSDMQASIIRLSSLVGLAITSFVFNWLSPSLVQTNERSELKPNFEALLIQAGDGAGELGEADDDIIVADSVRTV